MLNESYKSTQIEGTQISQDEMYYLKYLEKTDDNIEIQNLKKTIEFAYDELGKKKEINMHLVNNMHQILLNSVRGAEKTPGEIRKTQNWIGPRGMGIDQCSLNISKINRIKEIYKEDMKKIEAVKGNSVYKIMPVIMRQIVFTKKEVQDESGVSVNVVSNIINKLVAMEIIVKDSMVIKKGYRYQRIYDVFVGNKEYY